MTVAVTLAGGNKFVTLNSCSDDVILGIGIGYWYRWRPIVLGIGYASWYRSNPSHSLKLVYNRYHYDLRKLSFAPRIVNSNISRYNRHFQKKTRFWQHQDILYDYKVELTRVGNRSQINTDDNIVL